MNRGSWLALFILSFGWGTRGVATRAGLEHGLSASTLVGIRLALAAGLVVLAQVAINRHVRVTRSLMTTGVVMAVVNIAVPFWFFTIAFQYASAGFVGLMAALTPLMTALLAHFLLPGELMTGQKTVGLTLGIVGVGVLLASGDSGLISGGNPILAVAWSLPAVVSFSFSTVFAKRREDALPGLDLLVIQLSTAAVISIVPLFLIDGSFNIDSTGWALLVYLAVGSTVVPLLVFYWILGRSTAGQTSLVGYLVPAVSVIGGIVLLGEKAQPGIIAGGLAILAGVIVADRGHLSSPTRTG